MDCCGMEKMIVYEEVIEDLKSLKPVWVGVNDDDTDTDAKIKTLIKKYKLKSDNPNDGARD